MEKIESMLWSAMLDQGMIAWLRTTLLRSRFHGMLELERIGGRRAGRTKKHRPYSRASMRLAEKEKISSSASSPSSPCKAFFQGGQVGPSCAVPVCHGNALLFSSNRGDNISFWRVLTGIGARLIALVPEGNLV
jgi:hypothetical protein